MPDRPRGRRVPPPAPTGLPDPLVQARVAEAVHRAICALLKTDGADRCAWYAVVAANVLPHVTGHKYTINSGSLTVATEPNGDGFTFNAREAQIPDAEFHSLLVRDHGHGRFEVADLAARHWKTWALRLGARWAAPDPPAYVWGWSEDLPTLWPLGLTFEANLELTNRHLAWFRTEGAPILRQLSGYALLAYRGDV